MSRPSALGPRRRSIDEHPVLEMLVGLGRLGIDWVRASAEATGRRPPRPPGIARRAVLGAIVSLPTWRQEALDSAPGRFARRAAALALETRPGRRLSERLARARDRARLTVARLVLIGEAEEQRGQQLARAAVTEMFDETCARLAESEALRRLVREQTTGLTTAAIARLRAWCALADDFAEATAARVLPRFRRQRPSGARRLLPAEAAR